MTKKQATLISENGQIHATYVPKFFMNYFLFKGKRGFTWLV